MINTAKKKWRLIFRWGVFVLAAALCLFSFRRGIANKQDIARTRPGVCRVGIDFGPADEPRAWCDSPRALVDKQTAG